MNQDFSRTDRVAQEIQRTLAELLHKEAKDPRFSKINLTGCKVTKDLGIAKVKFVLIGHNEADAEVASVIKALDKAKGFFRSELGKRLRLRITPEVRFYYDNVPEHADYMEQLIHKALHGKK